MEEQAGGIPAGKIAVGQYTFFAPCPPGTEKILTAELKALGIKVSRSWGLGVSFRGDLKTLYTACLRLRTASRLLLEIAQGDAPGTDGLYALVKSIPWEDHFGREDSFSCRVTGSPRDQDPRFAVLRVKDGIADSFFEKYSQRPSVDKRNPDIRVEARWNGKRARIYLNLSGAPLHERGYRQESGRAVLRETVAAAVLYYWKWPQMAAEGALLADPVCGSGTLLIEGALMALDLAPGLWRENWGFLSWKSHRTLLWDTMLAAEREKEKQSRTRPLLLTGWDKDPQVLEGAKNNARRAGLENRIIWHEHDVFQEPYPPWPPAPRGLIAADPPYGRRLSGDEDPGLLYRALGRLLESCPPSWEMGLLAPSRAVAERAGLEREESTLMESGGMEIEVLRCRASLSPPREEKQLKEESPLPPPEEESPPRDKNPEISLEQLRNRLTKNLKTLGSWAEKKNITSYRLYDADIPVYKAAVDWFEGRWLHVQEYAAPKKVPLETAARRLEELLEILQELTQVPRENIFLKTRLKGRRPYGKRGQGGERFLMREGGSRFWINLSDYLDTGIFLDFRPVRALVKKYAGTGSFLNLFGYTGTASVMAAQGGSRETTTVDVSATYLKWARDNFNLNKFPQESHQLIRQNAFDFLKEDTNHYDLILLDPPTHSNGKGRDDFSVQDHHPQLIRLALQRLAPGGRLLFSENYRPFRMDPKIKKIAEVREITEKTIPFDFSRRSPIHRCWILTPSREGRDPQ